MYFYRIMQSTLRLISLRNRQIRRKISTNKSTIVRTGTFATITIMCKETMYKIKRHSKKIYAEK